MSLFAFLDRDHSVAAEDYSRWLVPPAALAIHLSIGQAYAFSVFNLPLSHAIGITDAAPGDWKLSTIGWVFSVAIVFLGLSAALFGPWLERVGPRKAMFVSAPPSLLVIVWPALIRGLREKRFAGNWLSCLPTTRKTAIVSPSARPSPSRTAATSPRRACGNDTDRMV